MAALAVTDTLADEANETLQSALSRATWSDDMVADYFDVHALKARSRNGMQNLRYAKGWCRRNYAALNLTVSDLEGAFNRAGRATKP